MSIVAAVFDDPLVVAAASRVHREFGVIRVCRAVGERDVILSVNGSSAAVGVVRPVEGEVNRSGRRSTGVGGERRRILREELLGGRNVRRRLRNYALLVRVVARAGDGVVVVIAFVACEPV
jgi:hypothetical protein